MSCPKCGCKVCYTYDDDQNEELERCAACGEIFSEHEAAPDDDDEFCAMQEGK